MSPANTPFDNSRPRPVPTALDTLRTRIDHDDYDGAVFTLESVVADLGYGDVRRLPGSIAWIDQLRSEGKRIALVYAGENAGRALEIAGIQGRFDAVWSGPPSAETVQRALAAIDVAPDRALAVDVTPEGMSAARDGGVATTIAIARSAATPQQLRRGGADAVVADLQELLGPLS